MRRVENSRGNSVRRGAAKKTVLIVLVVLLVVGLVVCGICGGVAYFSWNFGQQMLTEQLKTAAQGNEVISAQIGEIESCSLNLTATAEASQAGEQRMVFDVVGSLGEGIIFAEQNPSNPQQPLVPVELKLPTGESFDLTLDTEVEADALESEVEADAAMQPL